MKRDVWAVRIAGLASTSLLEGLVFAERVAHDMGKLPHLPRLPRKSEWRVPVLSDRGAAQVAADTVRMLMWDYAGIDRTAKGLRICVERLDALVGRLPDGATEEANMIETAQLIAMAALMRKESRGGHYRRDFPRPKNKWRGRHIEF